MDAPAPELRTPRASDDLIAPVDFGPDAPDLADWMSAEPARHLRAFSAAANRGTGGTPPSDRGRWFDFILAAHGERFDLAVEDIEAWLLREGWPADDADRLAREYEFARALLARAG